MIVKPVDQRLNHSLDILGAFGTLKLSVPLTTSQARTVAHLHSPHNRVYARVLCSLLSVCY